MKCPKCGFEFKDPGRVKGGQMSKRKLSKRMALEMAKKSAEARRKIENQLDEKKI